LIATALALLGFLQLVFYPNLVDLAEEGWDPHMGRLVATWLDPNFLGGFFTFVSALAFGFYTKAQGKSKIALLFLIILLFSATVLTFSRSAYFAFAISFVCIGILKARKFLAIGLLVAIFTIMFLPRMQERLWGAFEIDETAQARIQSWAKVKEIISQNWLTGVGVNLLPYELLRRGDIENVYVHSSAGSDSSLANIWAMTGIFGLILTAFFILLVLKKSWNLSKERDPLKSGFGLGFFAGTLGLLFHSNFVNSLFYPPIMIVFWITTGLLLKYSLEESQSKKI
jgi:O-antigen ligase